ncbi:MULTISPECIES: polysaccharide biosynthesis/export family protein [Sphingomonas]|uniref:polysaccharide biosynthesis/export family protein n=1 Tax=Sphingomonas TaxID=13687 RepID=UPI001F0799AD|nr:MULTISPECIES: polysaccharide biosynthesis/export family protein [Sphingomonas]
MTLLSGCQSLGISTAVGPTRREVLASSRDLTIPGLQIIPVTTASAAQLSSVEPQQRFSDIFGNARPIGTIVGVGDVVEVTIWEAPPAVLFGGAPVSTRIGNDVQGSRPGTLPELMVGPNGTISVPFAGEVPAAGRSLEQIQRTIVARLHGKANAPQAIVRITRNATANVSVVGEVAQSGRVPLTPKGERLLDVIAAAGGTRQPIERITVQLARDDRTATMPLQAVVQDSRQNIILQKDDVLTLLYQPYSFTVLGAAGKNEEIRFEQTGLTLSQALGRTAGLQDQRADSRGVFIFRFEPVERLRGLTTSALPATGRVPVIYRVDLKNPETYFAAQRFAMKDGDVMYVANSPAAEFQRFVNTIASTVLPGVSVLNTVRAN